MKQYFIPSINKQYFQDKIDSLNLVVNDESIRIELKKLALRALILV
ncbi:hypothetical protein LLB_3824 [Legionella longbeachae D-4968]|nr:hypothetical protein LLB_3824 [Legionella longbeachae D-4968]